MRLSGNTIAYIGCFLIALYARLLIVSLSQEMNGNIDLCIYRDAGQLVASHVNPYDFNDQKDLRQQLRTDSYHYDPWVCQSQAIWDYYASSNLPLATIFFGFVEYFFASPTAFRYFFAFFDSLLAVFILAFVLNKWQYQFPENDIFNKLSPTLKKILPVIIGLSLGALSPSLLYWGGVWAEHKGMGLLFMLSAIYFSDNPNKILSLFISPILLGCSVSFIGLGVFIAPLCIYNVYQNHSVGIQRVFFYCLIAFLACVLWLLPFMPELLTMMLGRLKAVSGTGHGSMWVLVHQFFPGSWVLIKNTFIALFAGVIAVGFFRKRLNASMLSASLLYLFTCIYLTAGGMDRMNIAFITLIVLLGSNGFFRTATIFLLFYFSFSSFTMLFYNLYVMNPKYDGVFVLVFSVIYFIFLVVQVFGKKLTAAFHAPVSGLNQQGEGTYHQ